MLSLFSPWPWLALGLVGIAGFANGMHFENKYGSNARLVAQIKAELAAKNSELSRLKWLDDVEIPRETASRNQSFDAATQKLIKFGSHCKANKVDADVLRGIAQ